MTDNTEEWTNWIEHDGGPCPVVGKYCRVALANGEVFEKVCGTWEGPDGGIRINCWDWSDWNLRMFAWDARVVSYRIRRPRALLSMIEEAKKLDAPVKEGV